MYSFASHAVPRRTDDIITLNIMYSCIIGSRTRTSRHRTTARVISAATAAAAAANPSHARALLAHQRLEVDRQRAHAPPSEKTFFLSFFYYYTI
jgi:hypothetical protein